MDATKVEVNVEQIMREIRAQISMEEDLANLPAFEDIPIRNTERQPPSEQPSEKPDDSKPDWNQFRESMAFINVFYMIPYYWTFSGNWFKVFCKRAVRKLAKCLLSPIVEKQNELNARFVRCINNLYKAVMELSDQITDQEKARHASEQRLLNQLTAQRQELLTKLEAQAEQAEAQRQELLTKLEAQAERAEAQRQELLAKLGAQTEQAEAQRQELLAKLEAQAEQAEAQRQELLAKLEAQAEQAETQRQELLTKLEAQAAEAEEHRQVVLQREEDNTHQLRAEREEDIRTVRREQAENTGVLTDQLKKLTKKVELLDRQGDDFSAAAAKAIYTLRKESSALVTHRDDKPEDSAKADGSVYTKLDYFKFQNNFRGSRTLITQRQEIYLPYFEKCKKPVLDIGCGRGEFLQMLKNNGVSAYGIDLYPEYAIEGTLNGLDVREGDGIAYLRDTDERFGGIFAGQVIEHISFAQLQTLCFSAYEKLEDGGYLILETPNPQCLSIFSGPFYVDPTHQKPVHPDLLNYVVKEAGFKETEIYYTQDSLAGSPLPMIDCDGIKNHAEVSDAINRISHLLYGSQDYAIVAKK